MNCHPCRARRLWGPDTAAAQALTAAALLIVAVGAAWPQAPMLEPRYAHTATLLPDGRVLVVGGLGIGYAFVGGSEMYCPHADWFRAGPETHQRRSFHTATLLTDDTVLLAGGFIPPYSTSRTAELWIGDTFVLLESTMSAPRELHAATLLADGQVLISGGFVGGVTSLADCDLYDPTSRSFRPAAAMRDSRFGHGATPLDDGRVLMTGGAQYPRERTLRSVELYDPVVNRFRRAEPMMQERSRHTATLLHDGRVLVAGGNSVGAGRQLSCTELFDPYRNRWTSGPDMAEPRMDHTATLLPDGRVLMAGGFTGQDGPRTVASCEVYDPYRNVFAPLPDLPVAVHEHQAVLLPSRAVLVCGGMVVDSGGHRAVADTCIVQP